MRATSALLAVFALVREFTTLGIASGLPAFVVGLLATGCTPEEMEQLQLAAIALLFPIAAVLLAPFLDPINACGIGGCVPT